MLPVSLRAKYIVGTNVILLLIIGVFSWQTIRLQERQISLDERERVVLISEIIKNGLITIMLEGRGREFQKFLETLVSRDIEEVRVFSPRGEILSSTKPSEIGSTIHREDMDRFLRQDKPEVFTFERAGDMLYSMIVPIYNEPVCQKCHNSGERIRGILDVEVSGHRSEKRLRSFRGQLITFSLLTLALLSVSLSLLTRSLITKPIDGIIRTMKKVEGGDLHARFLTARKDEIGKLSESLSSMLSRLDQAQQQIERYHQDEMRRVEKMATIGELASAIAHEIKNPLAGISGAIQVFAEDFPENDPRREVILDIIKEIDRLDKAVKDLLTFAKPPSPHPVMTDVHSLMERLMNVIPEHLRNIPVKVDLSIGPERIPVYLDPELFQQVFLNIVLSSAQTMPAGGTLGISVTRTGSAMAFAFRNSGGSISEKDRQNMFKPFFSTKLGGTGLGLAISKNIVEQHGGSITVQSGRGSETVFTVTVPVQECEHEQL